MVSRDMGVSFLGKIPLDQGIAEAADLGRAFVRHYSSSPAAEGIQAVCEALLRMDKEKSEGEGGTN
jgi:hypothetical protein